MNNSKNKIYIFAASLCALILILPAYAADKMASFNGVWTKQGSSSKFKFETNFELTEKVDGYILWTLLASSNGQQNIGKQAKEYVRGTYDASTRKLLITGYQDEDPYNFLGLDDYRLEISPDGKDLYGQSKSGGDWIGRLDTRPDQLPDDKKESKAVEDKAKAACIKDNNDGTMTDPLNGLIWQTCALGETWEHGSCVGNKIKLNWEDAIAAAGDNKFKNKRDWILPSRWNFGSLIYVNFKQNCGMFSSEDDYYWTGSLADYKYPTLGDIAKLLNRENVLGASRDSLYQVRLARSDNPKERVEFDKYLAEIRSTRNQQQATQNAEKKRLEFEKIAQKAYSSARAKNTVVAYVEFLKAYPTSAKSEDAKNSIRDILRPEVRKAETQLKCEEARKIDAYFDGLKIDRLSNYNQCISDKTLNDTLKLANPQQMYLKAVKYESDGQRPQAKRIYLTIMNNFSTNPVAMKAADRLASMKDVELTKQASEASIAAAERAANASRDAANETARGRADATQRRNDFCSGKSSCSASCFDLSYDAASRCYSSCNSQYSGC